MIKDSYYELAKELGIIIEESSCDTDCRKEDAYSSEGVLLKEIEGYKENILQLVRIIAEQKIELDTRLQCLDEGAKQNRKVWNDYYKLKAENEVLCKIIDKLNTK